MAELVTDGRGFVGPYADTDAMASIVTRLRHDPTAATNAARHLADHVVIHHDIDVIAPQIREAVERHLFARG